MPVIVIPVIVGALALASPPAEPVAVEGFGQALAGQALAAMRGGDSSNVVVVEANNTGTVDGNSAVGTVGGANTVTGGAFGNAAGINTVIQNSGANVLIQSGTAVNVQFGGGGP
ncbi:hypothetical protein GCM10007164_01880 [Luteimonas padinae]|uniref:Curlin n=1 Tax=Luteimonas padinae TaxID=1714359 RepID=A0ABV6SYN6_9GAMM|nr:hypothetical protein [Luteimonas padinae]GHD65143.1 hypothetical protein GCM10007164_01880 [Luteimonas padinae]